MSFLRKLFGKNIIEVQNKWVGSTFLVEENPDLKNIFTDPTPPSPLRIATRKDRDYWKSQSIEQKRGHLGAAYLSHPNTEVRAATIPYIEKNTDLRISNTLAYMLIGDPSSDIRSIVARVIWERAGFSNFGCTKMTYALSIIRDVIPYSDLVLPWGPLALLRNAQPSREDDFNVWLMYAWCRTDDELAGYGYNLLRIYSRYHTFLDPAEVETRAEGFKIGDIDSMRTVHQAINLTLGSSGSSQLEWVWNGVGDWLH